MNTHLCKMYFLTAFIVCTVVLQSLVSQDFPPQPSQWVLDYSDILNPSQENSLNTMLRAYEDSTSNQIVVAIFQDAQGYEVEDFSIRLAEKWQVGQKGRDNGIILAIFMKEHKIRVEVGYGLEDIVPDAIAIQIAQNVISPQFKQGDYYRGIYEGCRFLMKAAAGKFKGLPKKSDRNGGTRLPFLLIIFFFIWIISAISRSRRRVTAGSRGWRRGVPIFWGGFGGGSRGGGFGGGGFSAGGGSFGGGGATGSW